MVDHGLSIKASQEAEPLTPRRKDGRCGRCSGHLGYDDDLEGDKCANCGRLAGPPPPPTAEEVRAGVLSELTALADGMLSASEFWALYVSLDDVAAICGAHKKNFREWLRYNGYLPERRRSPVSGKWADFLLIDVAKAAIKHRKGD